MPQTRADELAAIASVSAAIDELIAASQSDPQVLPYLHAWREVGFLLTEDNLDMFTPEEIDAFSSAVERFRVAGAGDVAGR